MLNIQPSNTPVQAVAIVGNTIHYKLTEDNAKGFVTFHDDEICQHVVARLSAIAGTKGKVKTEEDLIKRIFEVDNFNDGALINHFHFTGLTANL